MAGLLTYLKFILKRERFISAIWVSLVVFFTFLMAILFPSLLGDEASKLAMLEMLKSPPMVSMVGPIFEVDIYTASIAFAQMMAMWLMITVAVMNIFFVTRHTRSDEESGRLEMLRSLPFSKLTNPVAVMIGAVAVNFLIALLSTVAILIANIEGCSFAGAALYSLEISVFGLLMAAITLICAQLFTTSRGAIGTAFAMLGLFYLMRVVGDYDDAIISYISPMGLALRVYPFAQNNALPIVIILLLTCLLTVFALRLSAIRDLGEGMIPAKKGRAHAKKSLLSPIGYVLRLTKTSGLVWCLVVFAIGAMYGSMMGDIEGFIESNDFYKQLVSLDENMSGTLTEAFVSVIFLITAHIAVIPVIIVSQKLHSEENKGRLEQIIARSVKRSELMLGFVIVAVMQSILVLLSAVFGLFFASLNVSELSFGMLMAAGMSYLPAMLAFGGIGLLLTGALPKGGVIAWLVYAYSFVVVYLGQMLKMPDFFQKLSPFDWVPRLPVEEFKVVPLIILTLISALTAGLGIYRFNKRDIISQ